MTRETKIVVEDNVLAFIWELGEKLMFQSVMLKLENLHEDWEPWQQNNIFLIIYKEMGLLRKIIK